MLRRAIAIILGAVAYYVSALLGYRIIPNWTFIIAPIIGGFIAASASRERRFVIAVIAVLLAHVLTSVWGMIDGAPADATTLGSRILGMMIGASSTVVFALLGAYLSKLIFKKKKENNTP